MKIRACKINHMTNPLGFALPRVTASWVTESGISKRQEKARILVALDEGMEKVICDTGTKHLDNRAVILPFSPQPCTRYFWTVTVWGEEGDWACSAVNWFETGKMETPWQGKWIEPGWEDRERHPCFQKKFRIDGKTIKNARLYITGLGLCEAWLNGMRVGDEYFMPGCTAYNSWIQAYTYDIAPLLAEGENELQVLMGNGWAKGRFGTFREVQKPYTDTFSLLAEMRIAYEDGTLCTMGTDESWWVTESCIVSDGIYDGEVQDLTHEAGKPSPVTLFDASGLGQVEDRLSLPVRIREVRKPCALLHTPKGELVLDMGQNMTGWVRMRVREPLGTKVGYECGEVLQEGSFYRENLRTAKAEFRFVSDGQERIAEPHFTYFGFRYVKLEGFTEEPKLEDFEGCVVYSDLKSTGDMETGDSRVNRLFRNALWSQKGNFLDVPTDCPQRDERLGWTGDAQVFCRTASYNMDCYAFYRKYLHDVYAEQRSNNGMVGSFVPSFMEPNKGVSGFMKGGSTVWGDCAVIIPWTLYLQYGDTAILQDQYESMKAWVEWNRREEEGQDGEEAESREERVVGIPGLRRKGFHFGDWLALDGPQDSAWGGTDLVYIASAYYLHSAEILARTAALLKKTEDAEFYGVLSEKIRCAIRKNWFPKGKPWELETQTAWLLALAFRLTEEEDRAAAALAKQLRSDGMSLKTGFVGTPFLCPVLCEAGYAELAYELFFREEYPGWLYEVKMGATTIWERWNSILPDGRIQKTGMNSLNHYAYGSIVEWMYRYAAGIRCGEEGAGFRRFEISPVLDRRLGYVRAEYESAMGTIRSAWEYLDDDRVRINVTIPFDTECILRVRAGGERFRMEALDMTERGGRENVGGSFTEPDENGILLYAGTYEFIFSMPSGTDQSRTL